MKKAQRIEPYNAVFKTYTRLEKFIKEYCPNITNVKHKVRGKSGRGKPIDFTPAEKKEIIAAVKKFAKDITT